MPSLSEIRQQYPQYSDMSDSDLAGALHSRFYSDMPREAFDQKIGLQPAPPPMGAMETADNVVRQVAKGIPVLGGAMDRVAAAGDAATNPVLGRGASGPTYQARYEQNLMVERARDANFERSHPVTSTAANIGGGIAGTLPLIAAAPRAFGMVGNTLLGRAAQSGVGGAALGASDAAVRGDDVGTGAAVGGALGTAMPAVAAGVTRALSPLQAAPERQALVNALRGEGVELTAGQASGNRPLQWAESALGDMPFSGGGATEAMNRQGQQFTRAALSRAGENADLATPDVMRNAAQRIGADFETIAARNTVHLDPQFAADVTATLRDYGRVLPSQQKEIVYNIVQDLAQGGPTIPGTVYQEARSRLTKQATSLQNSDPPLANTLRGIRDALDEAFSRSVPAADQEALQTARGQWRNMRAIEGAMGRAGERTAEGYISPANLGNAVRAQGRPAYVRGHGDLAELARAGTVMNPLPQSGTAPRALIQALATGGGVLSGSPEVAAASLAGPAVIGRILMSGPVQGYLSNQLAATPAAQDSARRIAAMLAAPVRQKLIEYGPGGQGTMRR